MESNALIEVEFYTDWQDQSWEGGVYLRLAIRGFKPLNQNVVSPMGGMLVLTSLHMHMCIP